MQKIIDAEFEEITDEPKIVSKAVYKDALFFVAWMFLTFMAGTLFCMASYLL